jgi:hypothetical protein
MSTIWIRLTAVEPFAEPVQASAVPTQAYPHQPKPVTHWQHLGALHNCNFFVTEWQTATTLPHYRSKDWRGDTLVAFIKHNMPLGQPGKLGDQGACRTPCALRTAHACRSPSSRENRGRPPHRRLGATHLHKSADPACGR